MEPTIKSLGHSGEEWFKDNSKTFAKNYKNALFDQVDLTSPYSHAEDDSDQDDIDIQAISLYEGNCSTYNDKIRYCNALTLVEKLCKRDTNEGNKWVKPHLEVSVQGKDANMLLDSGADMCLTLLP